MIMRRRILSLGIVLLSAVTAAGAAEPTPSGADRPMTAPTFATPRVEPFGRLPDGREVKLYTLEVPGGWRATLTDYGAILTSLQVPQAPGRSIDVVLGFDTLDGYAATHPYFGAICGRVANRIAEGKFELEGKAHTLATNNGRHHLHGGLVGFDKKLWTATPLVTDKGPAVTFEMVSPDGDEGYPGRLHVHATYTLTPDGELWVEMAATSDRPTVVNLAHHSYWNLAGHGSGTIHGHGLAVAADEYLPVDSGGIPTGAFAAVAGTPFDLRPERPTTTRLGDAIAALPPSAEGGNPGGIDHNFVIRGWRPDGSLRKVAVLEDLASGRRMELLSDQPGLQVYTGNYLDGTLTGKGGAVYGRQAAVCLETQIYPDAVHHAGDPRWPAARLDPGQTYRHTMVHRFSPGR